MIPYKQLSLADIFQDCQNKFDNDKPAFLSLLESHIDIDEFIPISFRNHFYASTGRSRKYPLRAFLWALIIQRIFSIPTDQFFLFFFLTLNHFVISVVLPRFLILQKSPGLNRISLMIYNSFLTDLLILPSLFAKLLIQLKQI